VQAGLTPDGVAWAFTTFEAANWHPLTWISLELDSTLFGGQKAFGFHLTNVLLHTANTVILFVVAYGHDWLSLAKRRGGALFALPPAPCRIGRVGDGAEGRAQHPVLAADNGRLSGLRPPARRPPISRDAALPGPRLLAKRCS